MAASPANDILRNRERVRVHRDRLKQEGLRQSVIWLPEDVHEWISDEVKRGRFKNRSEAILAAVAPLFEGNENTPQS